MLKSLLELLPDNPFDTAVETIASTGSEWWKYVNYFVPVGTILTIATGWAGCMVTYLAWKKVTNVFNKVVMK